MVLEKIRFLLSGPWQDRGQRKTHNALGLSWRRRDTIVGEESYCLNLNCVLQFADVSRPGVIKQFLKCIRRNLWLWFAELLRKLFHELRDQRWNVLFAFPERWHFDLESV